jgi:hypothetical protein
VFVPDKEELESLFHIFRKRMLIGVPTEYAKHRQVFTENNKAKWWLRTPKMAVDTKGNARKCGDYSSNKTSPYVGVRPAIWVKYE